MSDFDFEWPPKKKQYQEKSLEMFNHLKPKHSKEDTIEFNLPTCTCPWKVVQNPPKEVRGHKVNCPSLILKKHSSDDDCGERGHFDINAPDPEGTENATETR